MNTLGNHRKQNSDNLYLNLVAVWLYSGINKFGHLQHNFSLQSDWKLSSWILRNDIIYERMTTADCTEFNAHFFECCFIYGQKNWLKLWYSWHLKLILTRKIDQMQKLMFQITLNIFCWIYGLLETPLKRILK